MNRNEKEKKKKKKKTIREWHLIAFPAGAFDHIESFSIEADAFIMNSQC